MAEKIKIMATRLMPPEVEARLHRDYAAHGNPDDRHLESAMILERAAGCRGIIATGTEVFDADLIARLPDSMEILATFSVGCDHIDLDAAAKRGLVVSNTPDVLTDATADITILCLLGAARLAQFAEAVLREGRWKRWSATAMLGVHMSGKRLGIVGMGRIGQATARRAKGFDMELHYHNRRELPPDLAEGARFHPSPDTMLPLCDFLALTCPLTPDTRHWLNAARIAQLPPGAVVANSGRGPVLDDDALIPALQSGHLAAAGLDVFTGEPALDPRYLDLPNVFLLPHVGSATVETRNDMGFCCLDNLDAHFAGRSLPSRVV